MLPVIKVGDDTGTAVLFLTTLADISDVKMLSMPNAIHMSILQSFTATLKSTAEEFLKTIHPNFLFLMGVQKGMMPLTAHLEFSLALAGKCLVPNLVTEPGQTTCLVPP